MEYRRDGPFQEGSDEVADPNGPTVVMIADGWTRRIFRRLLDDGLLPEVQEGLIGPGGLVDVVSNLPTVSLASHTTILTSSHQDVHGVIGHRWKDSRDHTIHNYIGLTGPRKVNQDISPKVQTIFETVPEAFSVQGIITRGATKAFRLPTMRSGPILRKTASTVISHPNATVVTWLPRGDALAHTFGPDSDQVRRDMRETSSNIGSFLESLDAEGLLTAARIVLVPDHGHRAVNRTVSVKRLLATVGIQASVNSRAHANEDLALTSGDSSALIYLRDNRRAEAEKFARELAVDSDIEVACVLSENSLHVFNADGAGIATYTRDEVHYQTLNGLDPLGLNNQGEVTVIPLDTPYLSGRYPDFLHQVRRSYVSSKSGNILIMASEGRHFGVAPRFAWRFGYHRGSHGGPFEDEILVSAAFRGIDSARMSGVVRSADLLRHAGIMPIIEDHNHECSSSSLSSSLGAVADSYNRRAR